MFEDVLDEEAPPLVDEPDPCAGLMEPEEEAAWWAGWFEWIEAGCPEPPPPDRAPWSPVYEWSKQAPDGLLWQRLLGAEPGHLFNRIERVGAWSKLITSATGHLLTELAGYHDALVEANKGPHPNGEEVFASATAEYALMARVATSTAKATLNEALDLSIRLPDTLAALTEARITLGAARAISDETASLGAEESRAVERKVLPEAAGQTPAQVRAAAKKAALQADPDAAAEREKKVRETRRVEHSPARDGMSWLSAWLPAETATAVFGVLDEYARAAACAEDDRSIDERRADVLADLILNPRLGHNSEVKVHLHVVVSAASLLGLTDEPAELAGYGPISADLARDLAADATWSRILTDPAGEVIEAGGTQYRPSARVARNVRARDQRCRFPGCRQPAHRIDLDHTIPHGRKGGKTVEGNLTGLCRFHHGVKHLPSWGKTQGPGGVLTWTTPSGHTYTTVPPPMPGHGGGPRSAPEDPADDDA